MTEARIETESRIDEDCFASAGVDGSDVGRPAAELFPGTARLSTTALLSLGAPKMPPFRAD